MLILTQKRDHLHEILCSWTYNCDKILYTNLILNNRPALLSARIFSLFLWKEWNSIGKFRCIAIPSTDSNDIHTAPQLVSLLKTPRHTLVYATYKKISFKKRVHDIIRYKSEIEHHSKAPLILLRLMNKTYQINR